MTASTGAFLLHLVTKQQQKRLEVHVNFQCFPCADVRLWFNWGGSFGAFSWSFLCVNQLIFLEGVLNVQLGCGGFLNSGVML